jgi:hypothetical protein
VARLVITKQIIKDRTPGKYVSEAEFIGRRLGVAFAINLLSSLETVEVEPGAKAFLEERLEGALGRTGRVWDSPRLIVAWFEGFASIINLFPVPLGEVDEFKKLIPSSALARLV